MKRKKSKSSSTPWPSCQTSLPIWAAGAAVAATLALLSSNDVATATPTQLRGITGTVTCANRARVVGVYVRVLRSQPDSGWADWEPARRRGFVARYFYEVPYGSKFKIGVGCGGSPKAWRDSLSSRFVPAGDRNFVCYPGTTRAHPERGCFLVR